MSQARLIIVGGFLGAGKTTLLWEAARRLAARGRHVGLVTNDQAPDLVDTAFLARTGSGVEEVAGSCFCCNFEGLARAVGSLFRRGADCVIAEPVGSCTDLSATILQPLKDRHPEYPLAPFSVLVDPRRLAEASGEAGSHLHENALYILRLQMKEADRLLVSKVDTLSPEERRMLAGLLDSAAPGVPASFVSSVTGEGIDAWLDDVLASSTVGERILDVDYDRYAEGEAVLGWLNAVFDLSPAREAPGWRGLVAGVMAEVQVEIVRRQAEVGHVKVLLQGEGEPVVANLTALNGDVSLRGPEAPEWAAAALIVNARVQMAPDDVEHVVCRAVESAAAGAFHVTCRTLRSLSPGRPHPTYRYPRAL